MSAAPPGADPEPSPAEKRRVGTLSYTRAGLVTLFFWLLWGDFCFTLLETVGPSLLPLLLREHGASNREIAILVGSIASVLNMVVTPVVSMQSDRHRGPLGRRIPFLAWPTPFIAVLLGLIPFAPEITRGLLAWGWVKALLAWSPIPPLVLVFAALIGTFQLFNMVVASVYYYLFKDVVPDAYLGRFLSLFRSIGLVAGFVWNYFIFGMAESHMREIFVGISLLYGVSFALMCWRVREGEYPPPPPREKGPGFLSAARTFLHECFKEPLYLWIYAARTFAGIAGLSGVFSIFFLRDELGFDLDRLGKLGAWQMLVGLPLAYPFGMLMDRWKPMRVYMLATFLFSAIYFSFYFYIRDWTSLIVSGFFGSAISFVHSIAVAAWTQSILPAERFGQFAAAASLITAAIVAVGAPLCGLFFDWVLVYRFHYIWFSFFLFLSFLCLCKVHQHWVRHGGPDHYVAP
ncbi:MAG: hypothetical protein IT578_00040 [Verrucomicrobiae bacterium]|nr:hypothetical protein [Verrucomicrobiae bacterium]